MLPEVGQLTNLSERIDLRKEAVKKIVAYPECLRVAKASGRRQVLQRGPQYPDLHSNRRRNSFFASVQSSASTRPAANSASVFLSSS